MSTFLIKKNKPGFSLMELSLYVFILSIMSIIVANTFVSLSKGGSNVEAKSELNSNFRFAVEKIKRDVAVATAISSPTIAGANSNILDITVAGQSIKYTVTGNRLTRQAGVATAENITTSAVNITELSFTRMENVNPVSNKKRISVEMLIGGEYGGAQSDVYYKQSQKTSLPINSDF